MDTVGDSTPAAQRSFAGEAVLFLVCVVVAITIWVFNALSETYEQEIDVRLSYTLPSTLTTTKPLPSKAGILVETSGWQLIRERFRVRALQLDISDLSKQELLLTNDHLALFASDMPSDMHVIQVHPDTLDLHLEPLVQKQVPVVLNAEFLDRTDMVTDSMYIHPDSIWVSGPESLLRDVAYWPTEVIRSDGDTIAEGITPLPFPAVGSVRISAIVVEWYAHMTAATNANAYMTISAPGGRAIDLRVQYSCIPAIAPQIGASDFNITFEKTGDGTQYHVVAHAKRKDVHTIGVFPPFISVTD